MGSFRVCSLLRLTLGIDLIDKYVAKQGGDQLNENYCSLAKSPGASSTASVVNIKQDTHGFQSSVGSREDYSCVV